MQFVCDEENELQQTETFNTEISHLYLHIIYSDISTPTSKNCVSLKIIKSVPKLKAMNALPVVADGSLYGLRAFRLVVNRQINYTTE